MQRMLRAHLCGRLDAKRPLLPGDGEAFVKASRVRDATEAITLADRECIPERWNCALKTTLLDYAQGPLVHLRCSPLD